MKAKSNFPASMVRDLVDYRDGLLFWRERPVELFQSRRACKIWNKRFAGKAAGHVHESRSGKRHKTVITINGASERLLASRLVWAWHRGTWPEGLVDHEDGDTLNDRIGNLRDVTSATNSKNMRMHPSNKSGVTGVFWSDRLGKWVAGIMANRKAQYLGVFTSLEEATAVRKSAEIKYGFHKNHGRHAHV